MKANSKEQTYAYFPNFYVSEQCKIGPGKQTGKGEQEFLISLSL